MNSPSALHIHASGHVQGVGFRAFVASTARRLRISGRVRNCSDGSVEIVAEGDPETLASFMEILNEGNGYSSVKSLTADPVKPGGHEGFTIEL